ncbi:MAG: hypothetical protein LBH16_07965 [Treponema sp.]|jgi:hypothetical protein|nr:hypothetical protein [Treponema sp.]
MAAEYDSMTIPSGSTVSISNHEGEYIAGGSLLEDYMISINSDFEQLIDSGGSDAFTVLGGALKTISPGNLGFSGQFKQMGFVVWKGTQPIKLQFSLEFYYTYNAAIEVVAPIRNLCKLPLPGEGVFGNLIPPGPSVLEAISGTRASNVPPSGEAPAPAEIDQEATKKSADSYVNIRVGNMLFMGCVVTGVEPTFSKNVDEGNSPIYGRVVITAQTMYTATKESLRGW